MLKFPHTPEALTNRLTDPNPDIQTVLGIWAVYRDELEESFVHGNFSSQLVARVKIHEWDRQALGQIIDIKSGVSGVPQVLEIAPEQIGHLDRY